MSLEEYDGHRLIPETKCFLEAINAKRIPDIAFLTRNQICDRQDGAHPVPAWMVEIITPNEVYIQADNKVDEYFAAGVRVVWHVFPLVEKVRIFRPSEPIQDLKGDQICSASPVLPEFELRVSEVFRKRTRG